MDDAVALVRTYLQLNGYFTVTEWPVIAGGPGKDQAWHESIDARLERGSMKGRIE